MAFTLANFNCIANGPMGNVYTYHTADSIASSAGTDTYFTSGDPDGLKKNDIIFVSHSNGASVSQLITLLITNSSSVSVDFKVNS